MEQADQASASQALNGEMQAEMQMFKTLNEIVATVTKGVGEALSSVARKQ
jgi:hypothetical protein